MKEISLHMVSLENIVNWVNPIKDLEGINFYKPGEVPTVQYFLHNISTAFTCIKYPVRGAIIGGTIGAFVTFMQGSNFAEGLWWGAASGMLVDGVQYGIRMVVKFIEDVYLRSY